MKMHLFGHPEIALRQGSGTKSAAQLEKRVKPAMAKWRIFTQPAAPRIQPAQRTCIPVFIAEELASYDKITLHDNTEDLGKCQTTGFYHNISIESQNKV